MSNISVSAEKVAILDCGGQYTKVIDRKVRELGVYTDIFPMGVKSGELEGYGGIILSGGPSSIWENGAPAYDDAIFRLDVPILGICYGMQLICNHFGGVVAPSYKTEYGDVIITVDPACPLFRGMDASQPVLMSHGDAVQTPPQSFKVVGRTGDVTAAIWSEDKKIAGVQFHPEVELTENGILMLENFLRGICGFTEVYALEDRIQASIQMIQKRVGDGKVVVLVSGGVDSAVTAALLVKALRPEQVYAIHIDHGLMRKNESDIICRSLEALGLTQLQRIDAQDVFFNTPVTIDGQTYAPLRETCEPEKKRAIIGHMFFIVTEEAAKKLDLNFDTAFLAQGTLRPDLIESGNPQVSGYATKIKTHHNDVGIIRNLRDTGHVIETNWDWHKDEVRRVARMLGLGEAIASRQPFPGPGLGVRLICCDGPDMSVGDAQRAAADAFVEKASAGSYGVRLGPVRSVGVQGDNRSYKTLATLYPVGRSPSVADIDWEQAFALAKEIPNQLSFINRVALCLHQTGSGTPEILCAGLHIQEDTVELLQEIDAIVTDTIVGPSISQCFAVLLPMSDSVDKKYSCAIRAVCTSDFMTARSAVPGKDFSLEALKQAVSRIINRTGDHIAMIFYDVTGKPPATVEWE